MTIDRTEEYLVGLLNELRRLPRESELVEFKHNDAAPDDIGEYTSALANSAALEGKACAYLVWGIDDATHSVVGTAFSPAGAKLGNEELENWLLRLLSPKIDFHFYEFTADGRPVTLMEIGRAFRHPVQFKNQEFIRVGTYKKKLKEFPEKERALWRIFDITPFEDHLAAENLGQDVVLRLLDYPAYFDLLKQPLPDSRTGILNALASDRMIVRNTAGAWNITNLGGVLLAKRLDEFRSLARKAVRVVVYKSDDRLETIREQVGGKGYAAGFEGLIGFVNTLLPTNEVVGQALRKDVPMYPEVAIRELVANAIIHQDFFIGGTGPLVEIFRSRMEITNPGVPLVDTNRFLDSPPRSRNEALASFMRRIGVCEERGSGVDKVIFETEFYQLPAPLFEVAGDSTRVMLFAHKPFGRMAGSDRIRACYLHACLKYVQRDPMTNSTLRARFGISEKQSAMVSRIIKETVDGGLIRPFDEKAGRKFMKYVPFWA
jgi:predicted HTH transcriptional regulator